MAQPALISARLRLVTGLVCMAAMLAGLTGCAKGKTRIKLTVIDGYWHTSNGKVDFNRIDGKDVWKRFDILETNSNAYLIAEKKGKGVVINPTQYGPIFLFGGLRDQTVAIRADQAFYQLLEPGADTWPPQMSLSLANERSFDCDTPEQACISNLGVPFIGEITKAKHLFGYRIRYHIPYSTEGQDFLIDITLEFKKDKFIDWSDWHFPGSP